MATVTQNTGEITLFRVIDVLFQSGITTKSNHSSNSCTVEVNSLEFPRKPEEMDNKDPATFDKLGNSNSMTKLSIKKKERDVVQLLATKFRTKSADELGSSEEIKLNPIMKDLIINGYADGYYTQYGGRKRKKQRKKGTKVGTIKNVEEDQPSWLDTLKEEIANLK
jgi:hypothetical protein